MKNFDEYQKCLNCEIEDFRFRKGYCTKCYPLISRIEKIEKGVLPEVLRRIKENFNFFEAAKKEYIRQIRHRLEIIKESRVLQVVGAHDVEYRINETLRLLDNKSLGKFNDPIAHYLKDNQARSYVYQLFSKIQLLKPFRINYWRVYDSGR